MKTIDEMIAVMQAYKDGKKIECKVNNCGNWTDAECPSWDWDERDYRVKNEPEYVPYDSVDEVDRDAWIVQQNKPRIVRRILAVDKEDNTVFLLLWGWITLDDLYHNFAYEDGSPCGKVEEGECE